MYRSDMAATKKKREQRLAFFVFALHCSLLRPLCVSRLTTLTVKHGAVMDGKMFAPKGTQWLSCNADLYVRIVSLIWIFVEGGCDELF